jgi:hypothetical protein
MGYIYRLLEVIRSQEEELSTYLDDHRIYVE